MAEREPDDLDEEALRWEGDDERGLETPLRRRTASGEPGAVAQAGADPEADADPPATSALVLVVSGVLAGATLVSMLAWFTAISASTVTYADLLSEVMYQFGEFLAIAGPALWFAAVVILGRGTPPVRRLPWHLLGLVVTAPWPLLLGGLR